jgi:Fe-S oxidoreductase
MAAILENLGLNMNREVAYFAGCASMYLARDTGRATIDVLRKNGFQTIVPDQECCGAPKLYSGKPERVRRAAESNVRSLAATGCDIITDCPTCTLVLKYDYPRLLGSGEAESVARRTYDIFEYLVMLKAEGTLDRSFGAVNVRASYHAPCHLKALGEDAVNRRLELFRLVPGLTFTRLEGGCCGMGGTFGLKRENYAISMRIGQSVFEEVTFTKPDLVATDCLACQTQIQQGTRMRVVHPIILLDQAYKLQDGEGDPAMITDVINGLEEPVTHCLDTGRRPVARVSAALAEVE